MLVERFLTLSECRQNVIQCFFFYLHRVAGKVSFPASKQYPCQTCLMQYTYLDAILWGKLMHRGEHS